jgi:type I restriction enzyme S subunit
MAEVWPEVRFESLFAEPSRNGVSVPKSRRGDGVFMVNMGELFAQPRLNGSLAARVPLTEAERSRLLLEPGDLLFARRSLTVEGAGQCSIVLPCTDERTWESSIIRVRLNTQEADPSFYFYYFRSAHGRQRIETIVEQVAAAGIRNSDLRLLLVPLPPLSEQRAIAEVLGALDDKIEANQNLCSIIGGLARAKVVAAQAVAEHAVPLGNLVRRVTDIARPDELEAGVVYVGLEHIPRGSLFLTEWGSAEGLASAKARFQPGDILFGKLRPYFKKVVIAPSAGVCSTDVLVLRPRHSEQSALTLIICSSDEVINYASSGSHGTRMPRVSWDYLSAWQCPMPDEDTVQTIQQLVEPMLQQAVHLTHESILLAQLRDALLPKLLSGELRVHNAESLVKAAV